MKKAILIILSLLLSLSLAGCVTVDIHVDETVPPPVPEAENVPDVTAVPGEKSEFLKSAEAVLETYEEIYQEYKDALSEAHGEAKKSLEDLKASGVDAGQLLRACAEEIRHLSQICSEGLDILSEKADLPPHSPEEAAEWSKKLIADYLDLATSLQELGDTKSSIDIFGNGLFTEERGDELMKALEEAKAALEEAKDETGRALDEAKDEKDDALQEARDELDRAAEEALEDLIGALQELLP